MTADSQPLDDLIAHAHETRVVVIGGGIAGLVAAYEFAKVGMPVVVLERDAGFGGAIGRAEIDGMPVSTGATGWSAGSAEMAALVAELGLSDDVVEPKEDAVWIAGLPRGGAAPLPTETVLGIPANPWDPSVHPFIGLPGAWRAYLDRLRPPFTIGKQHNLATLVRSRMGAAVLDNLVAPLSVGAFGIDPVDVDVVAAAPGLSSALTRTGSLGGAVADLLVDRPAGAAVRSLDGGLPRLVDALCERLRQLGAQLHNGVTAMGLVREAAGWTVSVEGVGVDVDGAASAEAPGDASPRTLTAEIVVVATDESAAAALLAPHVAIDAHPPTHERHVVTLVVDAPSLDSAPRGATVHAVPGTAAAASVAVDSVRWAHVAALAGAGRHVLQVALAAPPEAADSDAAVVAVAREAASVLLGVGLPPAAVRGWNHAGYELARPASAAGHEARMQAARSAVSQAPGLVAVGAWMSGSGIAQVVRDTMAEAESVRQRILWGPQPER
ncbi:oxygen-dependent protoporphyrinogen oxidase [Microbacterium terrae]|uniref:Protoporphyrinogen oxidase n=1 Tax=Microbacterium terrae TaxID=69369 RepID=A0A0M2H1F6_9MICO|nr:Protoporphyrinogen oxidase [Microbacterium terrae]MBP1079227.1 oxygen-dependent protoporphyrinogen oxidase [Microbacterium terrae]